MGREGAEGDWDDGVHNRVRDRGMSAGEGWSPACHRVTLRPLGQVAQAIIAGAKVTQTIRLEPGAEIKVSDMKKDNCMVIVVPYTLEVPGGVLEESLYIKTGELQPCPGEHGLAGLWRCDRDMGEGRRLSSLGNCGARWSLHLS